MSIKKTAIITVFMSAIFVSANLVVAQAYEPLVRLPGLPAEGQLSLSQYIVGLYNFLLSIVGIVAVMMLIIGGMKYIAAAGNASVIADAKDTISNAIFGLLLALLSWVIVSTINPDVLYIKNPASSLTDAYESNLDACGIYIDPVCTCKDETTPAAVDQATCEAACADNCGTTEPLPCIYGGSSDDNPFEKDGIETCHCVDGEFVELSAAAIIAAAGCNEVCSTSTYANPNGYHGISHNVSIGEVLSVNDSVAVVSGDGNGINVGNRVYFDFTKVKDCKNDIISRAVLFENGVLNPGLALYPAMDICCTGVSSGCPNWALSCAIPAFLTSCDNMTLVKDPLFSKNPDEMYYIRPANGVLPGDLYPASGLKKIWMGITTDGPAGCQQEQFLIDIEVLP